MAEVNYCWGSERPSARKRRLARLIEADAARRAEIEARHARELADHEALLALRQADIEEVDLMTGGTGFYDRALEADPKVADRVRAENTQVLYRRGAKLVRSTMKTRVLEVADRSLSIRKGGKAKAGGGKRTTKPKAEATPALEMEPVSALPATASEIVVPGAVEAEPEAVLAGSEVVSQVTVEGVAAGAVHPVPALVAEAVIEAEVEIVDPQAEALVRERRLFTEAMEGSSIDPSSWAAISAPILAFTSPEAIARATAQLKLLSVRFYHSDFYTSEREVARLARLDLSRIPKGVDLAFGDHWGSDPQTPPDEIFQEFPTCGLPWNAPLESLAEDEARAMWGLAMKDDAVRPYTHPIGQWRGDVRFYKGIPNLFRTYASDVDVRREEDAYRCWAWELVIARRDLIKGLLQMLALGELTLDPASWRLRDRMRSVRYLVFRNPDFMFLLLQDEKMWRPYALRSVDKLPWPEGFDRLSLIADFGGPMDPQVCPPIGPWVRPPLWLLPEEHYHHSVIFTPVDIDEVPYQVGPMKDRLPASRCDTVEEGVNYPHDVDRDPVTWEDEADAHLD
jgi:hypothetical protein